jgi:hypothetical protein
VNPFRREEGEGFLRTRTHNRRRWSHIFPQGKLEHVGYYGLNWKVLYSPPILVLAPHNPLTRLPPLLSCLFRLMLQSLSQPAILPSSTDFLVPLRELQDEEKFEIQGNYSLIIDPKVRLSPSPRASPAGSFHALP